MRSVVYVCLSRDIRTYIHTFPFFVLSPSALLPPRPSPPPPLALCTANSCSFNSGACFFLRADASPDQPTYCTTKQMKMRPNAPAAPSGCTSPVAPGRCPPPPAYPCTRTPPKSRESAPGKGSSSPPVGTVFQGKGEDVGSTKHRSMYVLLYRGLYLQFLLRGMFASNFNFCSQKTRENAGWRWRCPKNKTPGARFLFNNLILP